MTCPACGARNPASAAWCSLCYAPLRTDPPVAPPPAGPDPHAGDGPPATRAAGQGGSPPASATSRDGRFRRSGDDLDWRCAACDTWNPIDRRTCRSCGASFTDALRPAATAGDTSEVGEGVAVLASLLLPGAGHLLLGRTGAGVLRIVLYVTWSAGGLMLLRAATAAGGAALPAMPLLAGAFAVLVASVIETQRTATGDELVILRPRVALWLVVGVMTAVMLASFTATMSVPR